MGMWYLPTFGWCLWKNVGKYNIHRSYGSCEKTSWTELLKRQELDYAQNGSISWGLPIQTTANRAKYISSVVPLKTNTMDHLGSSMGASIYVFLGALWLVFARICSLKYRFALWQSKSLILIPTIHAARDTQQTYPCMVSELCGWIFNASSLRKKKNQPKNSDELGETFKTPKMILAWNPKHAVFNGCLLISNHFPNEGLVYHPIERTKKRYVFHFLPFLSKAPQKHVQVVRILLHDRDRVWKLKKEFGDSMGQQKWGQLKNKSSYTQED